MVSIKCIALYAIGGGVSILFLRHRPAGRAMLWLLVIWSFVWLTVLQAANPDVRPAAALVEALPDGLRMAAGHIYAIVAMALTGCVVNAGIRLRLLRIYSTPMDIHLRLSGDTYSTLHCPQLAHQAALYSSGQLAIPTSFGVLAPAIIVPASPPGTIYRHFARAAVVHEFIAVMRFDALWTLLARLVQCLYFAHPVVWLAFCHYCVAREQVCDRWTVRATGNAAEYEGHLLALAGQAVRRPGFMYLDTPMSRGSRAATHRRIANLQHDDYPSAMSIHPAAVALVAWLLLLAGIAGINWPVNRVGTGPVWQLEPMLMGITAAAVAGVGLSAVIVLGRKRRARLVPPIDGLAGQSRATIADCVQWLTREWRDVQMLLGVTARRLEPVLLVALLLAATALLWVVASPSERTDHRPDNVTLEAPLNEP
jgi:hypothetical protein